MKTELHFSTGNDEHDTPYEFFAPIAEAVGGFDLDPCASSGSDLADTNYTKEDDGLSKEWRGRVYVNPPYSDIRTWASRCAREGAQNDDVDLVVMLAYARTSTRWFHESATTADRLCFKKGRLTFAGSDNAAPAPSLVAVWGSEWAELDSHLENIGFMVYNDI